MNRAIRRGISAHAIVEAIETARMRLDHMGLDRLQADRVTVVVAMMLADDRCTPLDAIEAADRLFPLAQTGRDDEHRD